MDIYLVPFVLMAGIVVTRITIPFNQMLVLDFNHQLHQNLLVHFLQSRGLNVIDRQASIPSAVVLLTDRFPQFRASMEAVSQIWLLDSQRALPTPIPPYVRGLLVNDCDLIELETCIRRVLMQQSYVSPTLINLLTKQLDERGQEDCQQLTRREQEVFELIKTGLSIREIADKLFISPHTAENHRANIQRKMALTGRLSLVRYAVSGQKPVK